ncbi:MAG: D-alanyl-D-alanine carboxypeptidase family protein, partial [Eubacterium sp.]|nr:D-alanyl-D-alanine carboxypeptidase family protein [Eubacterium sp.]
MNRITLTVIIILILGAVGYFWVTDWSKPKEFSDSERPLPLGMETASPGAVPLSASGGAVDTELLPGDMSTILDPSKSVPLDITPESITVLVNRAFLLPESYVPAGLTMPDIPFDTTIITEKNNLRGEAALQIEKLFAAAKKKKIELTGVSGYRSYERQK